MKKPSITYKPVSHFNSHELTYNPDAKWTKKLEFESGTDKWGPKLEPIPDRANCYTIGGKVDVLEDFHGEFSIYLELRNTASKKQVPESCVKQGPDGCGGFGSCLYCNACKTFGDNIGVQAQLLLDGNPIKCSLVYTPQICNDLPGKP
ncbi:hypothetical protein ANCDUO_03136 [Ancylostoma duodenale]|uniref:Uncharacterized protein n=1 Tax=Ancylostoma duodenale TaxID=51022 RepID=A0A0C2H4R5_9BILA|nr:hypothetical protein ANCDUO_03136 [Ancylostoma duodenale]